MRAFLQGWRRKIGCGLLLLACALVAPWTYSYSTEVALQIPRPYLQHLVESRSGSLSWSAHPVSRSHWKFATYPIDSPRLRHDPFEDGDVRSREWTIPYWSLILPLTAISAGLIFWGMCRSARQPPATPKPDRVYRWRRKVGWVTLAMACGFLVMWVRSGIVSTVIDINNSQSLFSQDGSLYWSIDDGFEGNPTIIHRWFDSLKRAPEPASGPRFAYLWKPRWHHGVSALSWGYDMTGTIGVHWLQIHYGIVVPLLACLAAWLILGARRKTVTASTRDANL